MQLRFRGFWLPAILGLAAAGAGAQSNRLSDEALARCASQALHLRQESARLHDELTRLDGRRSDIRQRSLDLDTRAQSASRAERAAITQERLSHNEDVIAFNAEIESLRRDIVAIDAVKHDYAEHCSGRPYRRSDLEALPAAEQEAMRAGLNDVRVPYLAPSAGASPPPTGP